MTMARVRDFMEANHGFPEMRLYDYEIALRDQLKLRKYLKGEDWYSVGLQMAIRKGQGKETEVVWNNRPLDRKKVLKDVQRYRGRVTKWRDPRGSKAIPPEGLILRTPPGSPPSTAASICIGKSASLMNASPHHYVNKSAVIDQLSSSKLAAHRKRVLFNQFMSDFLTLAQKCRYPPIIMTLDNFPVRDPQLFGNNPSYEVMAESSFILSNRIHGGNYWKSQEARWFLTWCGSAADPAFLWAYFSLNTPTVRAVYENLLAATSEFKDVPLFTALFHLRGAVGYEPASRSCHFFRTAVSIGSHASPMMLRIAQETCPDFSFATASLDAVPTQFNLSWTIAKAAMQADIPMMELCISIGAPLGDSRHALGRILENLLTSEFMEDDAVRRYAHLLVQIGFFLRDQPRWPDSDTGFHLKVWNSKGLTLDRLIYECHPEGRKRLYRLFATLTWESSSRVTLAGILTFAPFGPGALDAYLESHPHSDEGWDTEILERCLSEAASLGEIATCSSLLKAGVDPNLPCLSQLNHQARRPSLWNPLARAAMAGNPEMFSLLLADERLDVPSFLRLITSQSHIRALSRACRGIFAFRHLYQLDRDPLNSARYQSNDSRRSQAIEIIRTMARCHDIDVDSHILQAILGFSTKEYGIPEIHPGSSSFWTRLCRFSLDNCQALLIPGLVENNIGFKIHGMDLLHLSIHNGCSLHVAKLLLQKGFTIHSRPCLITGNTMLHSALLSQSMDRTDIVDLLLLDGADHTASAGGMTILEASLFDDAGTLSRPDEYLAVFRRLFDLGSPVIYPRGQRVGPERRCLINLLLEANAPDGLILQVVGAGCDVNDRGGSTQAHTTPLQQAIGRGRLGLATDLIQRGANVSASPGEDRYGFHYTALQKACATNAPFEFIKGLVEAGADVNEPPPARGPGLTSLEFAARLGSLNMAQYLLDQGARLNCLGSQRGCDPFTQNPAGIHRTRPLDWAASDGRLDMISFLLEIGGRSGRPGTTGLDGAIHAATRHNHFAVAKVLQTWAAEHGSSILEAEAAWQNTNMDSSSEILEDSSEDNVSESGDSVSSGYSDDSDASDEPLA